jgi:glyoxalase family protein
MGIHHITAIVEDPQENVDFYAGILGLRLVKKTVNFDDSGTYHFYFGNKEGNPGTIMTFFPWKGAHQGRIGTGQVGVTSFVVPENALEYWKKRLAQFNVQTKKQTRFGEEFLQFEDQHGLHLEIVARKEGPKSQWEFNGITSDEAIKGFGGAILLTAEPQKTIELLEQVMGLEVTGQEDDFIRLHSEGELGNIIDVRLTTGQLGVMGVGTVHHIAWRAKDHEDHEQWRTHVLHHGFPTTHILDRQYFKSIYFKDQGGILFEIATDPPGFARDEAPEKLGERLMLPSWLELKREEIQGILKPVKVQEVKGDNK